MPAEPLGKVGEKIAVLAKTRVTAKFVISELKISAEHYNEGRQ